MLRQIGWASTPERSRKMYVRTKPPFRPKLDEFSGVIDAILAANKDRPDLWPSAEDSLSVEELP